MKQARESDLKTVSHRKTVLAGVVTIAVVVCGLFIGAVLSEIVAVLILRLHP